MFFLSSIQQPLLTFTYVDRWMYVEDDEEQKKREEKKKCFTDYVKVLLCL